MSVLPFDLGEIIAAELEQQRKPNDGLLHPSSMLIGSLRHAQLAVAGAPTVENELVSQLRMYTGTMYHEWLAATLRKMGVPFMNEVNLTPWMPLGWGGTADFIILNPDVDAFVVTDLKTTKGEGMRFIIRDGAKEEHIWQVSLYWHAVKKMLSGAGKIAKVCAVLYLPMNDTRDPNETIEPVLVDFEPLPWEVVHDRTRFRNERVAAYLEKVTAFQKRVKYEGGTQASFSQWINDELEPPQERVQQIYYDRKTETWDVKLMPHWSTAYCPYPDELCDCSTQGQTKIGMYDTDGAYIPRTGYEDIVPTVSP